MHPNQNLKSASGSLQEGIAAPYNFTIGEVFKEAWQRTSGFKAPVLGGIITICLALAVLSFSIILLIGLFNMIDPTLASLLEVIFNFLISVVSYPLVAGILMMGLFRAVDAPVKYSMAFAYFKYSLPIIIATFFSSLLVMLGFLLLVIPGIYLSIAYVFTMPILLLPKIMERKSRFRPMLQSAAHT